LKALEEKLLRQDLFDDFCEEFTREMNRLRVEHRASLSAAALEIERLEARRKKLIEMVMEGVAPSVVKDELNARWSCGRISERCSARPYKRRGRRNPTTSPCKYLWLRGPATGGTCSCGAGPREGATRQQSARAWR
jgi:hypothetical protein